MSRPHRNIPADCPQPEHKETRMAFAGSAIKTLLDGAVAKGAVHGIAALVVDRNGALFHHAAGEANERTLFRNASMTKEASKNNLNT
jgi:CubicO group peptidase (beta-lactamase class C family)